MKIDRVHCLFEQSGTFRDAFRRLGYIATDYDIERPAHDVAYFDIFEQIKLEYSLGDSRLFSLFTPEDLLLAFFPCTYFSDQSKLSSRGDANGMQNWSLDRKLMRSSFLMENRAKFYARLCELVEICLARKFRCIIENPLGRGGFLKQYFPVKPAVIIRDRRVFGDYFAKPTQFFFINCEPEFSLIPEKKYPRNCPRVEDSRGFERSRISPEFADNFIKYYILGN